MLHDFLYDGYEQIQPVEIPDSNLFGIFEPVPSNNPDELVILAKSFFTPIEAPLLHEAVQNKNRVLLLIDDSTRGTPVSRILPFVLQELRMGGISEHQITILTAQGTHREMTPNELENKLGKYHDKFDLHQHRWLDNSSLHNFGKTGDGTPVTAHRLLKEADFILGIGSIVPHRIKGFSGGAKIAFPGVAGREIQERNQWEAALLSSEDVMGVSENAMRFRIEEAARIVNLNYVINVVTDAEKKIAGCFVGDLVHAHRAGCILSRELNAVHLPQRADIVLTDSYPADRDFWQSAKGIYSGTMAVREGGSLILVSPNSEGVADNHPEMLKIGYRPSTEIIQMVKRNEVQDIVAVSVLADVAQIIDKIDCILVSPGISRTDTERLGFRYARTPSDALSMALQKQGNDAKIAVLRHGGHILPVAGKNPGS
jgi:lactate racemase